MVTTNETTGTKTRVFNVEVLVIEFEDIQKILKK